MFVDDAQKDVAKTGYRVGPGQPVSAGDSLALIFGKLPFQFDTRLGEMQVALTAVAEPLTLLDVTLLNQLAQNPR